MRKRPLFFPSIELSSAMSREDVNSSFSLIELDVCHVRKKTLVSSIRSELTSVRRAVKCPSPFHRDLENDRDSKNVIEFSRSDYSSALILKTRETERETERWTVCRLAC
jgi:hypothetical protein